MTLYQTKNAQLFSISSFVSDPIKRDPILDQYSITTRPYTRPNGLKTISFPVAHTSIANIYGSTPPPPQVITISKLESKSQFLEKTHHFIAQHLSLFLLQPTVILECLQNDSTGEAWCYVIQLNQQLNFKLFCEKISWDCHFAKQVIPFQLVHCIYCY